MSEADEQTTIFTSAYDALKKHRTEGFERNLQTRQQLMEDGACFQYNAFVSNWVEQKC